MTLRFVFTCLFLLLGPFQAIADTDVVVFDNGDRLTGEIKSLERGKLRFKTDATDTISIEWDDVAFLSSDHNIQVELYDGRRYLGHLQLSADMKKISVKQGSAVLELAASDVVVMTPIEEQGLDRLDGDVTAGYNFTKADGVEQFTFGLDMEWRGEERSVGFALNSTTSNTDGSDSSQRHNATLDYKRYWPNRWLVSGFLSADRNDELGLDLRTSIGGGGGRILGQSNSYRVLVESGLQFSRENLSVAEDGTDEPDKDTVEAYFSLDWDWYRFDSPELDLSTSLDIIPNLTETGRVRAEFDISLRWEIIHDLFWQISVYDSYDSDPATDGAEQNDYGISTSLGFDF